MRLMQILLSQSEAGAETYFEKVAAAFAEDKSITQRLIIEALPTREARLDAASVDYATLPMGPVKRPLQYNRQLKKVAKAFKPDLIFTWINRASRKCPETGALVVGRIGGYYDLKNYTKCDHLVVNTPDLVRHVTEGGWDPEKVSMISNFGELPDSLQVEEPLPEIPEGHKVLLSLGRLHVKKAQDTLIKAMTDIPNTTLLLAGIGAKQEEFEQLTKELGLEDRVKFLGLRKDIFNLFKHADICVFPSRFEPLGNVVLEAWATETPIVAAASQGPSWLIQHEDNGLLFPVDDPDACAREVNRLLADESLQERLKTSGKKRFEEQHSMPVIMSQYKALFKKLLDQKRAK